MCCLYRGFFFGRHIEDCVPKKLTIPKWQESVRTSITFYPMRVSTRNLFQSELEGMLHHLCTGCPLSSTWLPRSRPFKIMSRSWQIPQKPVQEKVNRKRWQENLTASLHHRVFRDRELVRTSGFFKTDRTNMKFLRIRKFSVSGSWHFHKMRICEWEGYQFWPFWAFSRFLPLF